MTEIKKESQQAKESLQRAVTEALDKKKRLGQYAVVYKDGRPVRIGNDSISEDSP
jgi:hypothetical protein